MANNWEYFTSSSCFNKIMYNVQCSNKECCKVLKINIMNNNHFLYGFVCPYCKNITSANNMMKSLLLNQGK